MRTDWIGILGLTALACATPAVGGSGEKPQELDPRLDFRLEGETAVVIVAGFAPGAELLLTGLVREPLGTHQRVRFWTEVLADEGQRGEIAFELPEGVYFRSVWSAVDLGSGALATGAPEEFPLAHRGLEPDEFVLGDSEEISAVRLPVRMANVVLVRPDEGAWAGVLWQGGYMDVAREHNGIPILAFESLEPIEGATTSRPPTHLREGDVVVAVDHFGMALYTARIEGSGK